MEEKRNAQRAARKDTKSNVGQGFNNARGEIDDKKDTPKHNGLNLNNEPKHQAEREANKKK